MSAYPADSNQPAEPPPYPYQDSFSTQSMSEQPMPPPIINEPLQTVARIDDADCPPGLECLSQLNQLFVKQKTGLFSKKNHYQVSNALGQQVYQAKSDGCKFVACEGLDITIMDNNNQEVIHLIRSAFCFLQSMEVTSPSGLVIGNIDQMSRAYFKFDVKDTNGNVVLRIKKRLRTFFETDTWVGVEFLVLSLDGVQIGKINKEITMGEINTSASFPVDLDVKAKATLLGAVLFVTSLQTGRR